MLIELRRARKKIGLIILLGIILLILSSNWFWRFIYPLPYKDIIFENAGKYRVDPFFVSAIIKAESNFKPEAVSKRGARGIMQIMPETGRWAAGKMGIANFSEKMLYQPSSAIRIGSWYLGDLQREFNGNEAQVAAAYNAGRGNVEAWLKEKRWSGQAEDLEQIPFPETRAFVRSVLRYKWIFVKVYGQDV